MPSSAGHAARNLPPRDQFHIDGLDDEEEAGEEPHVSYDRPWSTQPPAGSHHPEPSQHAVVDSHDGHHSDNVDLLANLRHNEGRFDPKAADDGTGSGAETEPEDEPEPTPRMPNWYRQNMQRAALNAQAGGTGAETGPLKWMRIGKRTAGHQRLDAGHIDAQTGIEVMGEIKRSLDAHERDINSPSPHMIFQGREYYVLVEEATAPNGVTVTTFVAEVSKSQLEQVRKQLGPHKHILRAMQGVYYCKNCWEGAGCGCFFALSFSRNTCSHSVLPLGTVQMAWFTAARRKEFPIQSLSITSTFTHDCKTTLTVVVNELDAMQSLKHAKVPVQLDVTLRGLVGHATMHACYNLLLQHGVSMDRAAFYRWFKAEERKKEMLGPSAQQRLLRMQEASLANGNKFKIEFGYRGIDAVYVQTEKMKRHMRYASCLSIDGTRVNDDRCMLIATAKDALGHIHPVAFAVIFGGEKGDCFRELYHMAGMHGIPQLHDDGSCFDAAWLRLMEADGVPWFLCCWHFWFKMVSRSIKSWHPREPKLWEAVRILQLKVFPEGEDDDDIDKMVDVALRNLRALYTCDEAKTVIGKLELQKQRLLVAYRNTYLDDLNTSAVRSPRPLLSGSVG